MTPNPLVCLLAALAIIPPALAPAQAEEAGPELSFGAGLSSAVFDFGEQIAVPAFEAEVVASLPVGERGSLFAGAWTLQPVGPDARAFAPEANYFAGYGWSGDTLAWELGLNLVDPLESEDESTLEIGGEIAFMAPLNPVLAGFYDLDLGNLGLEASVGGERAFGDWTGAWLVRAGALEPDEGEGWQYGGVELALSRAVSEAAEFSVFARFEAASAETFADEIRAGEIIATRDTGAMIGVAFSVSH